jgi:hypothetical protein
MSVPEESGRRWRLQGRQEPSVTGSWLRTMLIGHPAIGYVLAILFPLGGALVGLFLLFWRETRRGLVVLALCVASTLLVVIATMSEGGGDSAATHAGAAKYASPTIQDAEGAVNQCRAITGEKEFFDCVMREIDSP